MEKNDNNALESIDNDESILNIQGTQVNAQMNINQEEGLELDEIFDFIKLIPSDKTLIEDKNNRYAIYSHLLELYCYVESQLKDKKFYFTKLFISQCANERILFLSIYF